MKGKRQRQVGQTQMYLPLNLIPNGIMVPAMLQSKRQIKKLGSTSRNEKLIQTKIEKLTFMSLKVFLKSNQYRKKLGI